MASRVEIGVVGVGPALAQLTTKELPETVVINFAKVCNLWCHHCLYQEVTLAREAAGHKEELFLPPGTMEVVADELATWSTPAVIRIAADGEPLIHPQALPMIRHTKARGLTVSLTTNGILLTEKMIRDLLDSRIDVIDISIDAATAETFAKVRPSRGTVNFYPVVERNVLALIAARNERRAATKVMVNLIDQPDAHDDVLLFIDQWTKRGADAVLIRPFHSTSAQTIQPGVITLKPRSNAPARFACKFPFTRMNVGFDHDGAPIVYPAPTTGPTRRSSACLAVTGHFSTSGTGRRWRKSVGATARTTIRPAHSAPRVPTGTLAGANHTADWSRS